MKYNLSLICTALLCSNLVYSQVQIVASNIGNNFSITYPANLGSPVTIPAGLMITFKSLSSISGISTLSVNGSTSRTIKKQVSLDLQSGDILNGQFVTVIYDGTFFQMLSASPSASGSSWLIGGNSISGTNTLGTLNAYDLSIVSNNIEGIRISSNSSTSGYVGIGTTTPTMPFHVMNNFNYSQGQSGYSGSVFFENNYLSVQSSVGIALYAKSNATQFGVGSVFESGQLGVYALAQSTGTGSRTGLQGIASGGDTGYGLRASGSGNQNSYGISANANSSNLANSFGLSANANSSSGEATGIDASANAQDGITYGAKLYSRTNNGFKSYAVYGENYNYISTGTGYGIFAKNTSYGIGYGAYLENIGSAGGNSYGIYSSASGGTIDYAGYFDNGNVLIKNNAIIGIASPYSNSPILHIYNSSSSTNFAEVLRLSGGNCNNTSGPMITFQNKCSDFTPTLYQDWITASIGSPYSGSYSGDLSFHTNDGSITSGSIQTLERMRITRLGYVGINTSTPTTNLEVNGFTKLGSNAPAIKTLYLTGTTASTEGGLVSLSLGSLLQSQIISISVMVDWSGNGNDWIQPSWVNSTGYYFNWLINGGNLTIVNQYNLSAVPPQRSNSILNKAIRAYIVYIP